MGKKNFKKMGPGRNQVSKKCDKMTTKLKQMRDKEEYFILIKEIFNKESIIFLNIYAPNSGVPSFMKSILFDFETQINSILVIADNLNTPLSVINRSSSQTEEYESYMALYIKWA